MAIQGFTYRKRTYDEYKKHAEQRGGGFLSVVLSGFPTFTPKAGTNWVRILPPTWENADYYGFEVVVHYGIGPDQGTIVCLDSLALGEDQKCPACKTRAKASFEGEKELADSLKPTRRYAVWCVDRNKQAEGPKVWLMGWTLDRDIAAAAVDDMTKQVYAIDDPYEGYDITFQKNEGATPQQVKYSAFKVARQPSSIPEEFLQYIVDHPIPSVLNYLTRDEIEELMSGGTEQAPPQSNQPEATQGPEATATPPPSQNQPPAAAPPISSRPVRGVAGRGVSTPAPVAAAQPQPTQARPPTALEKLQAKLAGKK